MSETRWHDCVWGKRQGEIRTWFGPGNLLQDDYVFCDSSLGDAVDEISVAKAAVADHHLSDHAPLIVDFNMRQLTIGDDPPD